MFRFFENLVDPYTTYTETDTPPKKLWPFLREYARPFAAVLNLTDSKLKPLLTTALNRSNLLSRRRVACV